MSDILSREAIVLAQVAMNKPGIKGDKGDKGDKGEPGAGAEEVPMTPALMFNKNELNIDQTNKLFKIGADLILITGERFYTIPKQADVPYTNSSSATTVKKLYFHKKNLTLHIDSFSAPVTGADYGLLGMFSGTGKDVVFTSFYPENEKRINVDGYNYEQRNVANKPVTSMEDGMVFNTNAIDIDQANKQIKVTSLLYIMTGEKVYSVPVGNIAYTDGSGGSSAKKLYFDKVANTLKISANSSTVSGSNYVLLGFFYGTGVTSSFFGPYDNGNRIKIDGYTSVQRTSYDWTNNKFVLPKELYLLTGIEYSIVSNSFNYNKFTDQDKLLFEVINPTSVETFETVGKLHSPYPVDFDTQVMGVYDGNTTDSLHKDITLRFHNPSSKTNKTPKILCIGDSITKANYAGYLKWWLSKLGFTPTMLGRGKYGSSYGYGITGVPVEGSEGMGGWRLTDFTGTTKKIDGSVYRYADNPFWNPSTSAFDFSYYMTNNSYSELDYVHIMLGANDISGHHNEKVAQNIGTPSESDILTYFPIELQKMIDSIKAFNPNVKIGINPPPLSGVRDSFNLTATKIAELQQHTLNDQAGVYCLGSYLSNGKLSGKTWNGAPGTAVSENNGTYRGPVSTDVHDGGNNASVNALWTASWIIGTSS